MRLLIIEDNVALIKALRQGLRDHYRIDIARDGETGLHEALHTVYDAIIMDLGLPRMMGTKVCQELRHSGNTTPILILTADVLVDHKVELLDAGADDYLTKPFSMDELRARLRVLLRHKTGQTYDSKLVLGDLELDRATRQVKRTGQLIDLRRKEFDVLEYLMHHAGTIVTRTMLIDNVWEKDSEVWANAVDVHIKHLRDHIDRPFTKPLIKTVYGLGYKLEAPKPAAPIPKRKEVRA